MNPITYELHGMSDKVVDTLLIYALSDLAERADKKVNLQWSFGHDVILRIKSSNPNLQETMFAILKQSSKSHTLANRLKFWLNIGGGKGRGWSVDPSACIYCYGKRGKKNTCDRQGNCGQAVVPAYAVFYGNVSELKTIDLQNAGSISKKKEAGYKTLYMGLSPYWSKGIRKWDSKWDGGPSTYVSNQLQILLLYGLTHYAVTLSADTFIQVIFSLPSGITLEDEYAVSCLQLIRRINNSFSLGIRKIRINNLPMKTIPLVLLSQLDLTSLVALFSFQLSLFFVAYDIDRAVPKNPRGYEEWSLVDTGRFYIDLGIEFWDFKSMIADLASNIWRDAYRSRIQSILLDIASAISEKNIWLLNDALLKVRLLSKELRLHLPRQNAILKAQQALK